MWCGRKNPEKIVAMASILLLGSVLPVGLAYLSQVVFGLFPCHFCMLQRYPYVLSGLCGIACLLLPRMGRGWQISVALGALAFLTTGALGLYHTGIERGWVTYQGDCVAQAPADNSIEALRAAIVAAPLVSCKNVGASFLGLSMASWNSVWAACMLALTYLQYRFERRHRHANR